MNIKVRNQTIFTRGSTAAESESMRINASGKIGINQSTPTEMLHVKDDGNSDVFGGIIVQSNNESATVKYGWRGIDGNDNVRIATGGNERIRVDSVGNVGIGTTTPSGKLTVIGNITLGSGHTVDGRDVSADGTKLDGIESGATADQTASEILTLIKTVDGAGSGLDADTLDGATSSFFQNASNLSSGTIPDARFPSTLPAVNGANLTGINTDLVSDTSPQLGGNLDTNSFEISFDDNHSAIFGNGSDLKIFHESSSNDNIIDCATTRPLRIRFGGNNQFEFFSSGGFKMNDGRKIVLGDSTDFTLFHDGGVGNIIDCRNAKPFFVVNDTGGGNETMIKATPNDRVELYYNGSLKLFTQSWVLNLLVILYQMETTHMI